MTRARQRSIRVEQVLVSLLAQGLKNWEIASSLTMPESALKVHLSGLFEKLGVKDRFELALFGLRNTTLRPGGIPRHAFRDQPPTMELSTVCRYHCYRRCSR